jgi:nucleoside-diphosphate-sugar epimerase
MTILITGGGGFIGSRLAKKLKERDPNAKIVLLDIAFPSVIPSAPPGAAGRDPSFERITGDIASPRSSRKPSAPTRRASSTSPPS